MKGSKARPSFFQKKQKTFVCPMWVSKREEVPDQRHVRAIVKTVDRALQFGIGM